MKPCRLVVGNSVKEAAEKLRFFEPDAQIWLVFEKFL
jgi:hypothetical protein